MKAVRGSTFLENDRGVYESGRWSTFWKIIGRLRKRLGSKLLGNGRGVYESGRGQNLGKW